MFKYIILGIVQGITEFFPVSSSGHLVIAQKVLGISQNLIELEIILHLGTLFAVFIFFFPELIKVFKSIRLLGLIAAVTLITGIIAILGKDFLEGLFSSTKAVSLAWIFTGIILLITKRFSQGKRAELNIKDALILGLTQAAAVIPGISRSGITISTLLFRKIEPKTSFTFSFLVSLPVILGAGILKAKEIGVILKTETLNLVLAFIFSFVFGLLSIWALKKILAKARFYYFGYYCLIIAVITLLFIK